MWKKRIISLVITTILIGSTLSLITLNPVEGSNGTTLYVGGTGPYNFTRIQDAINYSENGDTIYVYCGTYYENITINKSITLIGENKYNTTINAQGNGSYERGSVIHIDGRYNSSLKFSVSGFTIENASVGIYIENGTRNVMIRDCIVRYCIDPWMSLGIVSHNNDNVTIENCLVYGNKYGIIIGISCGNCRNISITECEICGNNKGILVASSYIVNITDNKIYNNTNYGIHLYASYDPEGICDGDNKNNLIENCTIFNNGKGIFFSNDNVANVRNNTVKNCNILSNNGCGLGLYNSSGTDIINCTIVNNSCGVHFPCSPFTIIKNCTIGHQGTGVNTSIDSNHSKIINCKIYNHTYWCIFLAYCSNFIIDDCEINNNSYGIAVWPCENSSITNCQIEANYYGIYVQSGDGIGGQNYDYLNDFYHNNFQNNVVQSLDMETNHWDHGYPSGGNYWSDYDGWDIYKGPNQDIPGGDEISDTPYNITGDSNRDRYPLMNPYSPSSNIYFQGLEPLYTTEYIEISITITPKEAIAGAQLDFIFDPDMLSIEWVAEGDVFSGYDTYFGQGVIDNTNGTLKNVVSLITTPGGNTTNQGSIAIVAIRAKTITGETPLNLSNVIIGRPDGTPIDVTIINTTVNIQLHNNRWDVNWDGYVNILDLILIGQWWGETGTPCWIPSDVYCDGIINILDMILVGQHWTG